MRIRPLGLYRRSLSRLTPG